MDVAHIYPFSLGFSHGPDNLIAALHMYWSAERINSWLSAITERGTKSPHNLICLTPTAHRLHGDAFFAFDVGASHIEEGTEMWLDLKFHWLKRAGPRATVPLSEIPSLDLEMPSDVKMTVHGQEDHSIRSGDVVRVETDDPEQKPLPLQHLIEMQWFLNRVAALSGAAEAVEPERLDSDDDDDDWSLRMPPSESVCDSDDSRSLGDSTLPSEMMPSSQDIRKQKPNDEPRE